MGRCEGCNGNCCTGPEICSDCDCGAKERTTIIVVSEKIEGRDNGVVRGIVVREDENLVPVFFKPASGVIREDGTLSHPLNGTITDVEGIEFEVYDWSYIGDLVD